jgi:hypothetical protein
MKLLSIKNLINEGEEERKVQLAFLGKASKKRG